MIGRQSSVSQLKLLEVVLTAECNLRCSYCYQTDKKNRRMEWPILQSAIDRLLASSRPDVEILFIGGEPLTEFPTIRRAITYIVDRKRPDMRVRPMIITNGLLLGREETAFLVEHQFHVKVSFDGVAQAQRLRGESTFDKMNRLLDNLRSQQPAFYVNQLEISAVLLPSTISCFADSMRYFLLEKNVHDLVITPQMTSTPDWTPERIDELEQAFERVFDIALERYRRSGDVPLGVFRKTAAADRRRPSEIAMCGVSEGEQIAVDVDGQVHGCVTFVESYQTFPTAFLRSRVEAMRLGDVRDINLRNRLRAYPATVRRAEIFDHKELKYSSYGRCGDCKYLTECSICPMSIGRAGEDDPHRIPDFPCAFNLISLKYRERFPRLRSLAERLAGPAGWPPLLARGPQSGADSKVAR